MKIHKTSFIVLIFWGFYLLLNFISSNEGLAVNKPNGIVVKGLYIGMPIKEAHTRLSQLFDSNWKVSEVEQLDDGQWYVDAADHPESLFAERLRIWADPKDAKVIQLEFSGGIINYLFNVSDMSPQEFAQAFVNHYGIPSMESKVQEENKLVQMVFADTFVDTGPKQYWEYKNPRGEMIQIHQNKRLLISKIATAKERKFD